LEPQRGEVESSASDDSAPPDATAFNATRAGVMRIRACLGIEIKELVHPASGVERTGLGFGITRSEDGLVYLSEADQNTSIYLLLNHTGKLAKDSYATIQASFLSTRLIVDPSSSSPVRRWARVLRLHTLRLKVTDDIGELFDSIDQDAFATGLVKMAARQYAREADILAARSYVNFGLVSPLIAYRSLVASRNAATKMALPEALNLLTLYVLGALKSLLFSVNDRQNSSSWADGNCANPTFNERGWLVGCALGANPSWIKVMIMPPVYKLTEWMHSDEAYPPPLLPSAASMLSDRDVVLVCSGVYLFLYVGLEADPSVVGELLIDEAGGNIKLKATTHFGRKVMTFAKTLCAAVPVTLPWFVLRSLGRPTVPSPSYPGGPAASRPGLSSSSSSSSSSLSALENWVQQRFAYALVEDRHRQGPSDKSYVEFLSLTHEHVKKKARV